MRVLIASAALSAAFVLMPVAAGHAPAWSQDFSITNPEAPVPADGSRRDVMRQLQAWWDVHGYYPRHASQNDEGGTVGFHLDILNDGRISAGRVVRSSGSQSLDAGAIKTFAGGFVRPLPDGAPGIELDIPLHYVLTHRRDQPVPADFKPVPQRGPFTISNDPVKSPILEKLLQKTCTGTIVIDGLANHPAYGIRYYGSKAIFFRRPDGTPWVKFYEGGRIALSPVVEVGKLVSWTGPWTIQNKENVMRNYTAWLDGDNKLRGCLAKSDAWRANGGCEQSSGSIDFSCTDDVVPPIEWDAWYATAPRPLGELP